MRAMFAVFMLAATLLTSSFAFAQHVENDPLITPIRRSDILPCDVKYLEPFADSDDHFFWGADHAGVAPVNRLVRGVSPKRLSEMFRGPASDRKYSDQERMLLLRSRNANEASLAVLLYAEMGTPLDRVPSTLPNSDYQRVLEITDDFEEVVLPCGTVIQRGITSSARTTDGRIAIKPSALNLVISWYERGRRTKDGVPGVRAFITKADFRPSDGPSVGVRHRIGVIDNCGNPFVIPVLDPAPVEVVAEKPKPLAQPGPGLAVRMPTREELKPPAVEKPAPQREPDPPRLPRMPEDRSSVSAYVGMMGFGGMPGRVQSEYHEEIRNAGDATQRHDFENLVGLFRYDRRPNRGLFASAVVSVSGSTGAMQFKDMHGFVDKKRDTDDSEDKFWKGRAGWKFPLDDHLSVGVFGGYSRWCLCEQYSAQGATTTTERSYEGVLVGAELSGTMMDRIRINVSGEFAPSLSRKAWTKQVYLSGQPGQIDFPQVNHPDTDAKSFVFRAEAEIRLVSILHAIAAWEFTGIRSERTNTFIADERVYIQAATGGLGIKWDW